MPSLEEKLTKALRSRQERNILRHLPASTESFVDFYSNDYLSLASNARLRSHFLNTLRSTKQILGSGGSRLLTDAPKHSALESRLASFFVAPTALLFNSGFDANVGFFTSVPQPGDVVIYDEYIHASVHDGMRASRVRGSTFAFRHNSLPSLKQLLTNLLEERPSVRHGESSVFIAVESLYSMDGDFAPLGGIADLMDALLPQRNGHLFVDEAHATGLYGEQGRGVVSLLGLENRVTARLHTFGKSLASSGAVILTSHLIREYLINYARSLIFTTTLTHTNVISINCSFDMLEADVGEQLSRHLFQLCSYFLRSLRLRLRNVPSDLIRLPEILSMMLDEKTCMPSPIIPLLTRYPRALAGKLQALGFLTRPISNPTVPKGLDRVRVCIHSGNSMEEIDGLIAGIMAWVRTHPDMKEGFPKL